MVGHYPIRFAEQLRQHLRALRKKRALTQAQLGQLIGVSQARIAEIEANPGLVSFEQLLKILSALDVTLALHETNAATAPVPDNPGAVAALLEIAANSPEVGEVLAQIGPDNVASMHVVRKLGFSDTGTQRDEHGEPFVQWVAQV